MNCELSQGDLINLICGSGPPSSVRARERLTNDGWLVLTGHQHKEEWQWNREVLSQFSETVLYGIYLGLKMMG